MVVSVVVVEYERLVELLFLVFVRFPLRSQLQLVVLQQRLVLEQFLLQQ
jgi:hypothetical protein